MYVLGKIPLPNNKKENASIPKSIYVVFKYKRKKKSNVQYIHIYYKISELRKRYMVSYYNMKQCKEKKRRDIQETKGTYCV